VRAARSTNRTFKPNHYTWRYNVAHSQTVSRKLYGFMSVVSPSRAGRHLLERRTVPCHASAFVKCKSVHVVSLSPTMMKSDGSASMEKEHKEDEASYGVGVAGSLGGRPSIPSNGKSTAPRTSSNHSKRLEIIHLLIGNCTGMCATFPSRAANAVRRGGADPASRSDFQFVELQGLRFIGLGAVVDELTPRERVYDTLEQLRTRTERLISIGYFIDKPVEDGEGSIVKTTFTVPLDVWNQNNDDSRRSSVSNQVQTIVDLTTVRFSWDTRCLELRECLLPLLTMNHPHSPAYHNRLSNSMRSTTRSPRNCGFRRNT
jgi:hypothetical protein